MLSSDYLLTDDQMQRFISHGYLVLKTDFPDQFYRDFEQRIEEVMDKEGNPGNNFLPRFPEAQEVFDNPVIRGALTSVLGPNYLMHPHRHCHYSRPGRTVQQWHKDSYWGFQKVRNHHPWWAMIFYYPQATTEEMGPSAILPGTQYYEKRTHDDSEVEEHVLGEAGTFALIHYDIWHKGTSNVSNRNRAMMKFQFVRLDAPDGPTWNNQRREWIPLNGDGPPNRHEVIWRHQWQWSLGSQLGSNPAVDSGSVSHLVEALQSEQIADRVVAADTLGLMGPAAQEAIPALVAALEDSTESVAVTAAYALSAMQDAARPALLDALRTTSKAATRNAGYAFSAMGATAIPDLIDTLTHKSELARGYAAFALGEQGARAAEAVPALTQAAKDGSEWVRRNVVEALGTIKSPLDMTVTTLADALSDADAQVRFTSALSLTRIGAAAEAAVPALKAALKDENRYVRANAVEALTCIDSPAARRIALDYLRAARWCPTTTPDNTF